MEWCSWKLALHRVWHVLRDSACRVYVVVGLRSLEVYACQMIVVGQRKPRGVRWTSRVQLAQEAVFVTTSFQCKLYEWTLLLVPQGAS